MVNCPICDKSVKELNINRHIDSNCSAFIDEPSPTPPTATQGKPKTPGAFFSTPAAKRAAIDKASATSPSLNGFSSTQQTPSRTAPPPPPFSTQPVNGIKRPVEEDTTYKPSKERQDLAKPAAKRPKNSHAPLAERMRPQTLDEVAGQALVGPNGVLRNLIETDRVPSMILWGGPGTGKTTIARLIAQTAGTRFVEINSTSSGVGECKRLFDEAKNELRLTGRKTIIFCDEIHRFSKSQQDVFLGPVEAGQVTLIGATTENPSFKVVNALLSRCRTFTLEKLSDGDVFGILKRALGKELPDLQTSSPTGTPEPSPAAGDQHDAIAEEHPQDDPMTRDRQSASPLNPPTNAHHLLTDDNHALLHYLSTFAQGDARTALNLLSLALDLTTTHPNLTTPALKSSLTQTLVYDRSGDQHYNTISALHKSIRGSSPDATLYYLTRMLQSGEDPLYIARRLVVIASEDVGLADSTLLPLATAAYFAAEHIGMPKCRINLAHCAVALALAPKSVRAYRGLRAAEQALREPGVAGLEVPVHLRNAPTKLMKEAGYGREYKYNPDYEGGRVVQEYLPESLVGRRFFGDADLGERVDEELREREERERREEEDERLREGRGEVLLGPDGD